MKILVVDDDNDSRVFLERALRAQRYEVESAADGSIALEKAYQWHPDLIISDILMPKMNGFELCRRIKSDERLRTIPFIFYTATFVDQKDEKLAMALGASRFLVKPMDPADFFAVVKDVVAEYETKELPVPEQPLKEMEELCRMQVDALQRKLDKKVQELEKEREELQESEERFRALAESTSDWIWEIDQDGMYTYASPKIKDILGYKPEEIVGKRRSDFMPSEGAKQFSGEFKSITESGKPFAALENVTLHKDGRKVVLETSGVPFFDASGQLKGYRGIDRDITERKKLEEQLRHAQKMEAIGTLAGGIAHDFNNILGGIIGYTELTLMRHLSADNPATEYLQEVLLASKRAKELVAQIMTFSHPAEQVRRPLAMGPIIEESLKLLKVSLPPTIEIRQDISGKAENVLADPIQIHQIILNLCTNAYHAMREKGGVIEISLNKVLFADEETNPNPELQRDVEYNELTIHDTGHGIEQTIIDRIFDPFFTTKRTGEGTGLGLAVVHGIVQDYGGAITVESTPHKGTTFKIYIPIIKEPGIEVDDGKKPLCRGTEKIMLVDDEKALTYILRNHLENLGYSIRDYNDPVEVLAVFKNDATLYDLVITDKVMPYMDGVELASVLVQIRPDIPVILCTGAIETIEQAVLNKAGIRKVLHKPLTLQALSEAIRQVLDKR